MINTAVSAVRALRCFAVVARIHVRGLVEKDEPLVELARL